MSIRIESASSIRTLELDPIKDHLHGLADSSVGKTNLENLFPYKQVDSLEHELNRVSEMKDILEYGDPFPPLEFGDFDSMLERARVEGGALHVEDFIDCRRFLILSRRVKTYFQDRPEKYPLIEKSALRLTVLNEVVDEINRVIDSAGQIKDRASDALYRIRLEMGRLSSQVRKKLESVLREMNASGFVQEEALVLREGRLVIPMKESHRGRLKGLVVDQSASGATLFMEPLEVLEINNEIRRLQLKEKAEIEKLLIQLTGIIRTNRLSIADNVQLLGDLDVLIAKARFSIEQNGRAARIGSSILELRDARHPLLIMRAEGDIVPLTLHMGEAFKTLIITGPNAGGKTVALKTIGILSLMHQYGLHVPVGEGSEIPLFSHIFADIGDRQSIQQDLSTFSSHIVTIHKILDGADSGTLVLLDELGSATDPAEGAALAQVFLSELQSRGCLTVATTHMGSLKAFAYKTDGMENGSMIFDQKTLRPTYRFQLGVPGSSYAFEIAERLGIPGGLVRAAKDRLGSERGQLDDLIMHLQDEIHRTHVLLKEAEIKESRLSGLVTLYEERVHRIDAEGLERRQKLIDEAESVLRDANVLVENLVREIRESQAQKEVILKTKKALESHKEKIRALSVPEKKAQSRMPEKGDWVRWEGHGGLGEVVSVPDKDNRVLVQWDQVKMRISLSELQVHAAPKKPKGIRGATEVQLSRKIGDEIDLRGLTVEEALAEVERYLADAHMLGLSQVRLIHGKGTGKLRKEIGQYLKTHPKVKTQRLGNWNEGDTGVTVVEMR